MSQHLILNVICEKKKIIPIIYNDKNEFSIFYLKSEWKVMTIAIKCS